MIKLRPEHLPMGKPRDDSELTTFIVQHLQQESPELVDRIPLVDLRQMVTNGVVRARSHGLWSLSDTTGFVSIMFEIAPDFDTHPELLRALQDAPSGGDDRLSTLLQPPLDRAWEEAAANYDAERWAAAWFPDLSNEED